MCFHGHVFEAQRYWSFKRFWNARSIDVSPFLGPQGQPSIGKVISAPRQALTKITSSWEQYPVRVLIDARSLAMRCNVQMTFRGLNSGRS